MGEEIHLNWYSETRGNPICQIVSCQPYNRGTLKDITKEDLKDLGIAVLGDIKTILKIGSTQETPDNIQSMHHSFMKAPAAKLLGLTAEMTRPQFRKFRTDWGVLKKIMNIPADQIYAQ